MHIKELIELIELRELIDAYKVFAANSDFLIPKLCNSMS